MRCGRASGIGQAARHDVLPRRQPSLSVPRGTIILLAERIDDEVHSMTVDELMRQVLALDAKARASMAHELLKSLESLSEAEIEQLWIEESRRRGVEIDAGFDRIRANPCAAAEVARGSGSRFSPRFRTRWCTRSTTTPSGYWR